MLLSDLPPEVMREITAGLGGSALSLWLCGCFKLNQLLGPRGGISKIHLEDDSSHSTSRWPICLSEMSELSELRIIRPNAPLGRPRFVWKELKKLNKLRLLHLKCLDVGQIVKTKLTKGEISTFGFFFPLLEDLRLSDVMEPMRDLDFPESLTALEIGERGLTKPAIASFGPIFGTLRSLSLYSHPPLSGHVARGSSVYPPNLERLKMSISVASELEGLPQNLTALDVTCSVPNVDASVFPLSLTELCVRASTWNGVSLVHLVNLKRLHLSIGAIFPRGHGPFIMKPGGPVFPSSLTSLQMSLAWVSLPNVILPPLLEVLDLSAFRCHDFRTDTTHDVILAPDESLDVSQARKSSAWRPGGNAPLDVDEFSRPGFPKTLRVLSLDGPIDLTLMSLLHDHKGLSKLRITDHTKPGPTSWDDFEFGRNLVRLSLPILPPSLEPFERLTHLQLRVPELPSGYFRAPLPSTLESFKLQTRKGFREKIAPLLALLPALSITKIVIDNESAQDADGEQELTYAGLHHISKMKRLKTLSLTFRILGKRRTPLQRGNQGATISGSHVLDEEEDFKNRNIVDESFALFPRSLRTLHLPGAKQGISGQCFQYLPRLLTSLHLPYVHNVSDEDVKKLPRGLRKLMLSSKCSLSRHCFRWVPTTLSYCQAGETLKIDPLSSGESTPIPFASNTWPDRRTATNSVHFTSFNDEEHGGETLPPESSSIATWPQLSNKALLYLALGVLASALFSPALAAIPVAVLLFTFVYKASVRSN